MTDVKPWVLWAPKSCTKDFRTSYATEEEALVAAKQSALFYNESICVAQITKRVDVEHTATVVYLAPAQAPVPPLCCNCRWEDSEAQELPCRACINGNKWEVTNQYASKACYHCRYAVAHPDEPPCVGCNHNHGSVDKWEPEL
jgi:hypothetical protein